MASDRPVKVLIVDDEAPLADIVASYLDREGYQTRVEHDGLLGLEACRKDRPDVVILDVMMPGLDGFEVCRRLRLFSDAYVIMLTARTEELDTIVGLTVGADDYLTKPFSPRELVTRVKVMLRRPRQSAGTGEPEPPSAQQRSFGSLTVDPEGREVRIDGDLVELTRTEFDILDVLSERPRIAFSRRQLVERVWGEGYVGDEHIVDVHIAHLRRKLGDDPAVGRFVRTVRGIGYRMALGI